MSNDELIIACTLNPDLVRERTEEWIALVDQATAVEPCDTGVRLRFGTGDRRARDVDATRVGTLVEAEHECCPFFSFAITVSDEGLVLDVTAPAHARPLVDVLLGDSPAAGSPDETGARRARTAGRLTDIPGLAEELSR